MRRIKARKMETETVKLNIFHGIHTANTVRMAERPLLWERQRTETA